MSSSSIGDHFYDYFPAYLLGVIALLLLSIPATTWMSARIDASTMREAGYEAKAINFDCFVKFQDRWVTCRAVANNQIQLIQ